MNKRECQKIGEILGSLQELGRGTVDRFLELDPRFEYHFLIADLKRQTIHETAVLSGNQMVDKYGYGWEVNKDIQGFVGKEYSDVKGELFQKLWAEIEKEIGE